MSTGQVQRPPVANSDASVITDASVTPNTAAQPNGNAPAAANPQPAQNTSQPTTSQPSNFLGRISLGVYGGFARTGIGGPNGNVFNPQFSNQNGWNWNTARIGVEGRINLAQNTNLSLDALLFLGYRGIFADGNAIGMFNGGELGVGLQGSWYPVQPFGLSASIYGSGLLMSGRGSTGNLFSWPNREQLMGGGALGASLGINIRPTRGFELRASATAETSVLPESRSDMPHIAAPAVSVGGMLEATWRLGSETHVTVVNGETLCDNERPAQVESSVRALREELATLRAENQALRTRMQREQACVDLASTDGLQPIQATQVSTPLPTDCDQLAELRRQLQAERASLDRQNAALNTRLGNTAACRPASPDVDRGVTMALLQLPSSNFNQGRPTSAQVTVGADGVATGGTAIAYLQQFNTPASTLNITSETTAAQRTEAASAVTARARQIAGNAVIRNIFPIASAELSQLARIANILLGYEDPAFFRSRPDMSSQDQDRIRQMLREMPIRIEAHASSEGNDDSNLALTQRRAALNRQILIALGVPAARLTAQGFGETQPLVSEVDERGRALRGQALTSARNRNRRVMYSPNIGSANTAAPRAEVPTGNDTANQPRERGETNQPQPQPRRGR